MTAHIMVPALDDPGDPATLSRPILTGILREELGYDGVVVTDSLGMEGVRTKYGDDRVPVLALKAGVDQLLNPPTLDVAWNAVLTGRPQRRADRGAARRIDPADAAAEGPARAVPRPVRHPARGRPDRRHPGASPGRRPDRRADDDAARQRGAGCCRFRAGRRKPVLVVGADPASPSGTTGPADRPCSAAALTELGFTATALSTGTAPTAAIIAEAVAAAERAWTRWSSATYNVTATSSQRTLVTQLARHGAAGGRASPSAIRTTWPNCPHVPAYLAAYSWTDVELRAAARVIAGRADPEGRLPVPVQRADDPTRVLYPVGPRTVVLRRAAYRACDADRRTPPGARAHAKHPARLAWPASAGHAGRGYSGEAMREVRSGGPMGPVGVACGRVSLRLLILVAVFTATGCQLSSASGRRSGRQFGGRPVGRPGPTEGTAVDQRPAAPAHRLRGGLPRYRRVQLLRTTSFTEVPCTSEQAAARVVARFDGRVTRRARRARRPPTSCCTSASSGPPPTRTATGRSRRATPVCAISRPPHPGDPGGGGGPRTIVGDCVYSAGRGRGARDGVRRERASGSRSIG